MQFKLNETTAQRIVKLAILYGQGGSLTHSVNLMIGELYSQHYDQYNNLRTSKKTSSDDCKATKQTPSKREDTMTRNKTCTICGNRFNTERSTAKYCSPTCKDASTNKTRNTRKAATIARRKTKLPDNDEWRYIAGQCKRAGTVEILHGSSADDLSALFALMKSKHKTYGGDYWHLCHIAPVSGLHSVGLLNVRNLFIGQGSLNQRAGSTDHGCGESISRTSLQARWRVEAQSSYSAILSMIVTYLGATLDKHLETHPVKVSERLTLTRWISEHEDGWERSELNSLSVAELRQIKHDIRNPLDEDGNKLPMFSLKALRQRSHIVLNNECKRLLQALNDSEHRKRIEFGYHLTVISSTLLSIYGDDGYESIFSKPDATIYKPVDMNQWLMPDEFKDWVATTTFDILSGKPLSLCETKEKVRTFIHCNQWQATYTASQPLLVAFGTMANESFIDDSTVIESPSWYAEQYLNFENQCTLIQQSMLSLGVLGTGSMSNSGVQQPSNDDVFNYWEQNSKQDGSFYICPF